MPIVSPRINGYYLVTTPWGASEEPVRLYDSTGRFLRVVGRRGDGPNEYRRPEFIHRVNDSAWIYDGVLRRLTTLLPPDTIGPARSWSYRLQSLLPLSDGTFVLTTGSWGSAPPMEHVDATGRRIDAFGDRPPTARRDWQWVHLAAAADGGLWSAPPYRTLQFQYWKAPVRLIRTLQLNRQYFTEYAEYQGPAPATPPSPRLIGFWADSANALWIVVQVPDARWPTGLGAVAQAEGHTYYPVKDADRVFDTIIERVDSRTGAQLVSFRLDAAIVQLIEPWVLLSTREDEDGWYRAFLWLVPKDSHK